MRIAAEISQHLHRSAERSFGVDHPVAQMQPTKQFGPLFGIGEDTRRSAAAEFSLLVQPLETGNELAAEHLSKHGNRQKEIILCGDPLAVTWR